MSLPVPTERLPAVPEKTPQSTQSRRDPPVETRWQKGVSGNPGGRPKGLQRRVREAVGDDGDKLVRFLVSVVNDKKARKSDRLEAAKILLERGWGKAPIAVDADGQPARFVLVSAFAVAGEGAES